MAIRTLVGRVYRRVCSALRTREPLTLRDLIGEPKYTITQPGKRKQAQRTWRRSALIYTNRRHVA